ncbi:MAG: methyl-accepting chemotaxis protein [Pseudomonadota bacterium]
MNLPFQLRPKTLAAYALPAVPSVLALLWVGGASTALTVLVIVVTLVAVVALSLMQKGLMHDILEVDEINKSLAIIEFTPDGTILNANDNFLQTMGYTLPEIQGKHHGMFVKPDYRESNEYRDFWARLRSGDSYTAQYERVGKGGKEVWISASYNAIRGRDGRVYKVVKLATDITRQRELLRDNAMVRHALDCSTANVMMADTDFNIVYMNTSADKLFRNMESDLRKELPAFSAAKLMGSKIDVFHKNPAHQQSMLRALKGTHDTVIEIGGRTVNIVATPVVSEEGERLGTVVDWADLTEETRTEKEVEAIVGQASVGQLEGRIRLDDKSGAMLRISGAVNELLDVAQSVLGETMRVFAALAQGDLSETVRGEYAGDFEQLKHDANKTVERLLDVIQNISGAVTPLRSSAQEIAAGNENLSRRTEQQASSLENTVASMDQLTKIVRQNAESASDASTMAREARNEANEGQKVVGHAVSAVSQIDESSKKIADIVGVIDEIAFQTNLLALNAAVEAARAGEQGRGFAVVANEVRNLAGRSASSAKEIKELIEDSVQKVTDGSRLVNESGEVLGRIAERVRSVTSVVEEIATASREQSNGIQDVNVAIAKMDEVTQQNAAMVEEATASSRVLGDQADSLQEQVDFFTVVPAAGAHRVGQERRSPSRPWSEGASPTVADNHSSAAAG